MVTTSCFEEALRLVEKRGFSVIPVGRNKMPLLKSWKEFQTRKPTAEELSSWWKQWPDANFAIVTGKISGITVIDVDTHKGGTSSADQFPKTYKVVTGNGGVHLYYQYEEAMGNSTNAYAEFPHVDIKNDGGLVTAPPSVIEPSTEEGRERGGRYEAVSFMAFAPFPVHLFKEKKKKARSLSTLTAVSMGGRNSSITSVIGTLLKPLPPKRFDEVWDAAVKINETYNPPLPLEELRATFLSISSSEIASREKGAVPSPIQINDTEQIEIKLRKSGNNVPYRDMENVRIILDAHPMTKGKIRYNKFREQIEYDGHAIEDQHLYHITTNIQRDILPMVSENVVKAGILNYAWSNSYDEAKDWLEAQKWDGVERLSSWLSTATGVENSRYVSTVGHNWFHHMVKRIVEPGCQFDHVLVLVGPQGVGKTSLFRIIGGPWYKAFTGALDNKDFYLALRGAAIMDLDEGATLSRADSVKIKSIITSTHDEYREPYGKITKKFPRRFVFSMSTNDTEPFRDVTGNRRYWPVDLSGAVNFAWLSENRDQLFAEAYHNVKAKVAPPGVPKEDALAEQEAHLPTDEWTDHIESYLLSFEPYCKGDDDFSITISELHEKVLDGDLSRLDRKAEIRIGNILRTVGMKKKRVMQGNERKNRYYLTEEWKAKVRKNPMPVKPSDPLFGPFGN